MAGKFLVFEWDHASGKTTLAKSLSFSLTERGKKVVTTKEPFNEDIRKFIEEISKEDDKVKGNLAIMYLLSADRYLHLDFIQEQLGLNDFVISDRYVLSSLVYQQMQGIPLSKIEEANSFCLIPYLTFFVDVSYPIRIIRALGEERNKPDTFFRRMYERESELYTRVCDCFSTKYNVFRVDNTKPLNEVIAELECKLEKLL